MKSGCMRLMRNLKQAAGEALRFKAIILIQYELNWRHKQPFGRLSRNSSMRMDSRMMIISRLDAN